MTSETSSGRFSDGLPWRIRIVLTGGDEATALAVAAEVAKLATVEFPQSIAEYYARFNAVPEPETAASAQEFVGVAHWIEQTPDASPVANVLVRVWPPERHLELREQVKLLATAAGGHVEFPGDPFPAMVNSAELSSAASWYLSAALGPESVAWAQASWPFNGEDFALFLNEAPGAMFYLGVRDAEVMELRPCAIRGSPSRRSRTRPIVAFEGEWRQWSRWRRTPIVSSSSIPALWPHSASSSMLLAPETVAAAHTSKIAVREYHRPCRDRGSGTVSR